MSLPRLASILSVFVLLFSAAAAAQVESTPIPMGPKPDFSKMSYMMGTWTCSTKSARRPAAFQTVSNSTVSPDGYWLIVRSTTKKTAWMPSDVSAEDRITYDASTNRWIDISTDNTGNYNVSSSPGWSGDQITWTDITYPKTNATSTTTPTVIKKVSDTKTTSAMSFTEPGGRSVAVTSTCTKGS